MINWLVSLVYAVALVMAVAGSIDAARSVEPGRVGLGSAALLELALLAQSIVAGIGLLRGHHLAETPTFIGYLLGVVVVVPVGVAWILVERSRWNGAILAVTALTGAIMTLRLEQMWVVTGG